MRTAFITAPGHIFMAFNAEMEDEQAKRTFLNPKDLIFRDGETWVPVEITLVRDGFLKAWAIGAKEWREASAASQAGFYPVRDAWKVYEPVGFSEIKEAIMLPDSEKMLKDYKGELERFIGNEVQPRSSKLKEELRKNPTSPKLLNSLGVLYARFSMLDEAAAEFQKILQRRRGALGADQPGQHRLPEGRHEGGPGLLQPGAARSPRTTPRRCSGWPAPATSWKTTTR